MGHVEVATSKKNQGKCVQTLWNREPGSELAITGRTKCCMKQRLRQDKREINATMIGDNDLQFFIPA